MAWRILIIGRLLATELKRPGGAAQGGKELLTENFVEGMACTGGCIGGAGCLTHGEKDKNEAGQVWNGSV